MVDDYLERQPDPLPNGRPFLGDEDRWHIRAEVRGLLMEEGGRRRAIHTDYRPAWDVGNTTDTGGQVMHSGRLIWEGGVEVVELGQTASARIYPLVEDLWSHVELGMTISAYEGSRRVCEALVTGVAQPSKQSSRTSGPRAEKQPRSVEQSNRAK